MAATRSGNAAVAKKPTAKATEVAQANTSKKRKNDAAAAATSSSAKPKATASRATSSKTTKSKATASGTASKKRKNIEDDAESPVPSAKKACTTQKATSSKAKTSAAKSSAKPKATKSVAAKAKTTKAKATAPKATSRKRKTPEDEGNHDDDESEDRLPSPPAKKARTAQKATAPRGRKPTAKSKVSKPKAVINTVPSQRLDVYVFGEGSSSELGLGTAKNAIDVKRPRLNPLLSAKDVGVVHVACGGMHVAALTHDNQILTWGVNDQGALGRDTTWDGGLKDIDDDKSDDSDQSDSGLNPRESNPTAVPASSFPEGATFVQLSAGDSHTLALTDEGLVYGWGCFRKTDETLGLRPGSDSPRIEKTPVLISELKNITHITSGANHAMALAKNGAVYIWGSGEQNQLGYHIVDRTGSKGKKTCLKPQPLRTTIKKYKAIYSGSDHSFAIDQNDRVWAWGVNSFGACGIHEGAGDDSAVVYTPALVENLELGEDSVVHMAGGQHHSIAITKDGQAFVWGRVDGGQTGLDMVGIPEDHVIRDEKNKARIIIAPTALPNVGKATWASAGTDHTILINEDGIAYSWGLSVTYQTGLGTLDDVMVPTHIDNTALRGKKLIWSGCGGQYSALAAPAAVPAVADEQPRSGSPNEDANIPLTN